MTVGQDCVVENTAYIGYGSDSREFVDVVSRYGYFKPTPVPDLISLSSGNCRLGLYCDAGQKKCMNQKREGESCTADKEYVINFYS